MAGSTAEVAQGAGEEIARSNLQVDVLPLNEVKDLEAYDGVVVGGPVTSSDRRMMTRVGKPGALSSANEPPMTAIIVLCKIRP